MGNAGDWFFFLLACHFVIANPIGLETISPLPYPISRIIEAISDIITVISDHFMDFSSGLFDRQNSKKMIDYPFLPEPLFFTYPALTSFSTLLSEILSIDLFRDIYFFAQVSFPQVLLPKVRCLCTASDSYYNNTPIPAAGWPWQKNLAHLLV